MGQIQNAANGLAQTALGAAVAGKHLKQQEQQLKEQEATKKLQGINAAATTQSQLNEVNTSIEQNWQDQWDTHTEKEKAGKAFKAQADYAKSGKHPNGLYNQKQLEAASTALDSLTKGQRALQDIDKRLHLQKEVIMRKAEQINELYGEKVINQEGLYESVYQKVKGHDDAEKTYKEGGIQALRRKTFKENK